MKKFISLIVIAVMILSLSSCANANRSEALMQKGVTLLHKQERQQDDIAQALQLFEKAAELGNDDACFLAGWTLQFEMMPQTIEYYKKANDYYEKCTDSNPYALIARGLLYVEGIAFDADETKALALIKTGMAEIDEEKMLADQDLPYYAEALNLLGILYLSSYSVEEDCEKSVAYFQKGVDFNSVKSLVYSGYMYLNGWGVQTDYQKAMEYFIKADSNACKEAMYYIGYMYHEGLGVQEDREKAFECYLQAAEAGHIYSMVEVSDAYAKGDGVAADQALSEQWYAKAATSGYVE